MQKTAAKKNHSGIDLYGDLKRIKAILADATNDARSRAEDMLVETWDNMKEKSSAMEKTAEEYVVERPFKSIGVAFAVGTLLGFLLSKK